MVEVSFVWSGNATVIQWYLSRDLKKVRKWAIVAIWRKYIPGRKNKIEIKKAWDLSLLDKFKEKQGKKFCWIRVDIKKTKRKQDQSNEMRIYTETGG